MGLLNTDNSVQNIIKITSASGGIYKTYPESWITRFHLYSPNANRLLNNPCKNAEVVLQMVICGDMEVMVELIKKEDFEKYFPKR